MHTWNFIEEEKIGKNRWIFFTDDGKNASEFLFWLKKIIKIRLFCSPHTMPSGLFSSLPC